MSSYQRSLVACVVAVITAMGGQPALAEGPTKEPGPSDPISFPAGAVCSFPLTLSAETNKASVKVFPSGRVMLNGSFSTRVTNDATGHSVVIGNSGPITITPNADGTQTVTARGQSLFFFFPGDLGPGQPGALLYMSGHVVEVAAADFSVIFSFSHEGGTTEDLCVTLR